MIRTAIALVAMFAAAPALAHDQDPRPLMAAEAEAMKAFDWMVGEWRGPAAIQSPSGERKLVQTERVGPLLGGTVRLIEGRGYMPDGSTGFNALAVIDYDPATKTYALTSWANGRKGVFPIKVIEDGFAWEIAAGPATIHYEAHLRDGKWIETGDRVMPGRPPIRFYEMALEKVGEGNWPVGTPVPPR